MTARAALVSAMTRSASFSTIGTVTAGEDAWSLTLTRTGASAGYGAYTVTFTQNGYDTENSTINDKTAINPMQTT